MIKIDARILKWTAMGMRDEGIGEYVELREVERMLEETARRVRLETVQTCDDAQRSRDRMRTR